VQLDVEYTTDLTRWEKLAEVTATGDWSEMQIPFEPSGASFFRLVFPESGVSF
jgi:hypothetical protein